VHDGAPPHTASIADANARQWQAWRYGMASNINGSPRSASATPSMPGTSRRMSTSMPHVHEHAQVHADRRLVARRSDLRGGGVHVRAH